MEDLRHADNDAFFIGNRGSHWMLVAFRMVGTSLSGVTFISVPGAVGATGFTYFQIILRLSTCRVLVIAFVLLPVYYRTRVISISTTTSASGSDPARIAPARASSSFRARWARPRACISS